MIRIEEIITMTFTDGTYYNWGMFQPINPNRIILEGESISYKYREFTDKFGVHNFPDDRVMNLMEASVEFVYQREFNSDIRLNSLIEFRKKYGK